MKVNAILKTILLSFASITGFLASIVGILTAPFLIKIISIGLLCATVVILTCYVIIPKALRIYRARRSLPADNSLDLLSKEYKVVQATESDVHWIAGLEASVYSKADAIPEIILYEWYAVNPAGFTIIKDDNGKPVGHIDLLPIRPATLEVFCKGDIVEREIRGDSLYSVNERDKITDLYVESIILKPGKQMTTAIALICLLQNTPLLIKRITEFHNLKRIYAIAATPAGENLIKKLGFKIEWPAEHRKDKHNLFAARPSDIIKSISEHHYGKHLTQMFDMHDGL